MVEPKKNMIGKSSKEMSYSFRIKFFFIIDQVNAEDTSRKFNKPIKNRISKLNIRSDLTNHTIISLTLTH